jgi:6-phosphogluconolactonase (cycloisomerase 2 family)
VCRFDAGKSYIMKRLASFILATVFVAAGAGIDAGVARAQTPSANQRLPFVPFGTVYTTSNAVSGNAVLVFDRAIDGRLRPAGSIKTGGTGTGTGLGSQGAIALSENERWLLAVNAGSNDVSAFEVLPRGLRLVDRVNTGGTQPISVAIHGRLVYVLNAGSSNISGFTLSRRGQLEPLPGSTRALSQADAGPAQVSFSADGDLLVVTEKNTNRIVTFTIDRDGLPDDAFVQPSAGATPFGFAVGRRDRLFVSEAFGGAAGESAVSSYDVDDDGTIHTLSASVPTTQTAACWVVVTNDGRFVYTTNTGSGSVTGYAVGFGGDLTRLDADGRTAVTGEGSAPADVALSRGGQFLYVENGGTHTIAGFFVAPNGRLVSLSSVPGLPAGAAGLAAR